MTRVRCAILSLALLWPVLCRAEPGGNSAPADLVRLERQVGLRVAHARDEGPVVPAKRKLLLEAQQYELNAEQALKAGKYDRARENFERAEKALDELGL